MLCLKRTAPGILSRLRNVGIEIVNTLGALTVLLLIVAPAHAAEPSGSIYAEHCAVCHGEALEGTAQGVALVGRDLSGGDSVDELSAAIADGAPERGMPAWRSTLDEQAIKSLALMVAERRVGGFLFGLGDEPTLPSNPVQTRWHAFSVELVAQGLDPRPFSIAVRPDGSILVTESMRGLRIVSPVGQVSDSVPGTPITDLDDAASPEAPPEAPSEAPPEGGADADSRLVGGVVITGRLLDVVLHPDFADNRWIYLHYTQRCSGCAQEHNPLTSRNVLVRGRIRDGRWVDEETIWQAPAFHASIGRDGGRIAFDDDGYVFITVGMRNFEGIQDLGTAHGKTHRLHDDGRIPADNPFVGVSGALSTIWTFGHRAPQGLVYDARTGSAWNTEHGPRGGDELNRLLPGRNYGWPLFSDGLNYDGTEVAWDRLVAVGLVEGRAPSEIDLEDTERPAKAWTPAIAVSNLVVYEGAAFPEWQGDFLIGSLKASDLFRVEVEDGRVVGEELLVKDLARIRDVDVDERGWIYLLLEHHAGGQIVRLKPTPTGG